jgi:hypothetical protein
MVEAIAHFPMYEPIRIGALYRYDDCVRRRAAALLLHRIVEGSVEKMHRRHSPARISVMAVEQASGWQENAVRALEDADEALCQDEL